MVGLCVNIVKSSLEESRSLTSPIVLIAQLFSHRSGQNSWSEFLAKLVLKGGKLTVDCDTKICLL